MSRKEKAFRWFFALGMLCFALLLAAWVPLRAALDFQLEDTAVSLETSRGRERKQRYEYDQVSEALPLARENLAETQPLADAASREVQALKETRKQLREEKKTLEAERKAPEEGSP